MRNRFTVVDLLDLLGRWTPPTRTRDGGGHRAIKGGGMTRDLVVGVDCSTTASKAVVWDRAAGRSHRAAPFTTSSADQVGEQNAEDWWTATREAIRRAAQSTDARRIAAIAITHQRETFACVTGTAARCARRALADTRATAGVDEFGTPEVHRITGKPPNPTPAWYKLLWLRHHEPETLRRIERVVDVQAYLVHRLTGQWRTSWASADPLGLVDMRTFDYDDGLLAAAGLTRAQLPELHEPGAVLAIPADLADELDLPRPARGGGRRRRQSPGWAPASSGPARPTSTWARASSPAPTRRPTSTGMEFRVLSGAVPRTYVFETFIGGGTATSLVRREVLRCRPDGARPGLSAEQVLGTAAAQLPPGADGLLVTVLGRAPPYWDPTLAVWCRADRRARQGAFRALLEAWRSSSDCRRRGRGVAEKPIEQLVILGGGRAARCGARSSPTSCTAPARRPRDQAPVWARACRRDRGRAAPDPAAAVTAMSGTGAVYQPDPTEPAPTTDLRRVPPALPASARRVRRAGRPCRGAAVITLLRTPEHLYDGYVFDLDGTVYLGDTLLPGAAATIAALRARGRRTVFLSNNPTRDPQMYADKLGGLGIATPISDIVNGSSPLRWLRTHHPTPGVRHR
jgi:xylulokinase